MKVKGHNSAQLHWLGMPDFEQQKQEPFAMINVRFEDEVALLAFVEATGMKLTQKTKSTWYPQRGPSDMGMKRWK